MRALDPASVIAGEAVSGTPEERWNDMVAIASVIANRAAALGVTQQQVIANTNEFNAYNRAMPPGTSALTDMAQEALNYVEENGPVNNATFYATPAASDNLPSGLSLETSTTGHQYYSDPQNRAIGTSLGYRQPNQYAYAANPENVPTPDQPSLMGAAGGIGQGGVPVVAVPQGFEQPDPLAAPTGLLGTAPAQSGFSDMAAAGPMGLLGAPSISQANIQSALTNATGKNEFDPSFTAGLMGPNNPVVPTAVETTSYTQPSVADVGTGINSPAHINGVQAQAEKQLAASRAVQPGLSVPASGLLASNPALEASATVPSFQSSLVAAPAVSPAEQAINSIAAPGMSPQQISGYQQAADSMAQAGMLNIGQQPPTDLSGNLPTNFNVLSSPALDTVSVPDQPTIAGPASTEIAPAQEQQQAQQVQQAVTAKAPQSVSLGDKLRAAVNPGTAIGGLLGGATMGPIGGLLGGLLGNSINNGSFSGLLGQGPVGSGGYVGYGPQAAYGVYGGGLAPGSYATASDGSTVTAQAGGDVARTNTFGVTDVANSYGGYSGDWSGLF